MNDVYLPALPEPAVVLEAGAYPPEQHPVLAYIGRLGTAVSREGMLRRLNIVARLLSEGTLDALHFPWHRRLTYVVMLALRAKLMEDLSPSTCNVTLYALKGVLRECWRLGYLSAEEHLRACDVPQVKGVRLPVGRALEGHELTQLLYSCRSDRRVTLGARDAAAIGILYGMGLRSSEAISLDLVDYEPMARTVRVLGKGNKEREMPCPELIAEVLHVWLDVRGVWSGPLLTAVSNGNHVLTRRLDRRSINAILRNRRERAGVAHFSPHDMRRTFISNLLDATGDLATVQALAGHADPKITALYDRRGLRAKVAAMGKLTFPTS
jgi:site-specific recombinase XerC